MKSFAVLSLAAMAAASAIVARDAKTVASDINDIKNRLSTLDSAVKAFNGDQQDALNIQGDSTKISDAVKKANSDVDASDNFNQADSGTVAEAVLSLSDPIKNTLADLTDKRDTFDKALPGVAVNLVSGDLTGLKSDTDSLGKAIVSRLTPGFAALAPNVLNQIDDEFNAAIKAFGPPGDFAPPSPTAAAASPSGGAASATIPHASAASTAKPTSSPAGNHSTSTSSSAPAVFTGAASKSSSFSFGGAALLGAAALIL